MPILASSTSARSSISASTVSSSGSPERSDSPLRRADGSVEIDTTDLGPEEVVERIVELARERGLA